MHIGRKSKNFNPRSPWGERLLCLISSGLIFLFQSTLPVGGATKVRKNRVIEVEISIHAPRGGSDGFVGAFAPTPLNFNPRSPWGERR